MRSIDRWLNPKRLVMDEFVLEDSNVVFKLRVIVLNEKELAKVKDPKAKHYYYLQFRQYVLDGHYTVTEAQSVELAAYTFFIDNGAYFEDEGGDDDLIGDDDDEDGEDATEDPTTTKGYLVYVRVERGCSPKC